MAGWYHLLFAKIGDKKNIRQSVCRI